MKEAHLKQDSHSLIVKGWEKQDHANTTRRKDIMVKLISK